MAASVEIPPSQSIIMIDSKYGERTVPMYFDINNDPNTFFGFDSPTGTVADPVNFKTLLNANVSGRNFTYRTLTWSQSMYTHSGTSSEFRFSTYDEEGSKWDGPFVLYHKPYHTFISFDGDETKSFPIPTNGSYCDDWEWAFNNDVRLVSNNTVPITLPLYYGKAMTWSVRYSPSLGIKIVAKNEDSPEGNITWRMEQCNSLAEAHFVHGFGILESVESGEYVPQWVAQNIPSSEKRSGKITHLSDSAPILIPIPQIDIFCPEISKDRRLQSFRNAEMPKKGNEVASLTLTKDSIGVFRAHNALREDTVWSVRFGTEPNYLTLQIGNAKTGKILSSSTCLANMFNALREGREVAKQDWFLEAKHYRSSEAMNILLFNIDPSASPLVNTILPITKAYGNPQSEMLFSEVVHYFVANIAH